ncbi:MAG: GGDEF domain-containing protein [Candidatus Levybacteria bacterium]|nr:GGDEF domain-containing protein [Candidatus Levybacteria bacterium]
MTDGQTPENTIATRPPSHVETPSITRGIEKVWGSDPEYQRIIPLETDIATAVIEDMLAGRLSKEEAIRAIAVRSAESKVASGFDGTTGLNNRTRLEERLHNLVGNSRRGGSKLTIAFADIDNFKLINDTLTHDGGDSVLNAWGGHILSGLRRETDFGGRYGGEEAVLVFPNTGENWVTDFMEGLRREMPSTVGEAAMEMGYDLTNPATMSIGIAELRADSTDTRPDDVMMKELIKIADGRMYLAKENGRNQTVDSRNEEHVRRQIELGKTNG